MEATPDIYRADITRTREAIAALTAHISVMRAKLVSPGAQYDNYTTWLMCTEDEERRRDALVRQLANLEQGLARAEALWAQAQAAGAGTRRS